MVVLWHYNFCFEAISFTSGRIIVVVHVSRILQRLAHLYNAHIEIAYKFPAFVDSGQANPSNSQKNQRYQLIELCFQNKQCERSAHNTTHIFDSIRAHFPKRFRAHIPDEFIIKITFIARFTSKSIRIQCTGNLLHAIQRRI